MKLVFILAFCVTTSLAQSDVVTRGGNGGGALCVFPFTYKGVQHNDCIDVNSGNIWCATTSNYDTDRLWGYCMKDLAKFCAFPFVYQGASYESCQPYGNSNWCAITNDYDQDGKWQYCPDDTPIGCDVAPCENGGVCTRSGVTSAGCRCPPNFTGLQCQYDAIAIEEGGATKPGSLCMFPFSYNGHMYENCTTGDSTNGRPWCYTDTPGQWGYCVDPCDSHPCGSDGTCAKTGPNNYRCDCNDGFTGAHCQNAIDRCEGVVCQNGGTCQQITGGYTCTCPSGFTGDHCEIDRNECEFVVCQNGGICKENAPGQGFRCECPQGSTGIHCEIDINECETVVCQNDGVCKQNAPGQGYQCQCKQGFTGDHCETSLEINPCSSVTCQNGAECVTLSNVEYHCSCKIGFSGTHCETDVNECEGAVCMNGGTCVEKEPGNGFQCHCKPGFTGVRCETDVDECATAKCLNGGTCYQNEPGLGYRCECIPRFGGKFCEIYTGDDDCDCDYHGGGCAVSKAAPPGKACQCKYRGGWTCRGYVTDCKDRNSEKCRIPDMSFEACQQGEGDCMGYRCDCALKLTGCVISEAPAPGSACFCKYNAFWCEGRSVPCKDMYSPTCLFPSTAFNTCIAGGGNCNGYHI